MLGKKTLTVKASETRTHEQKRLVLNNLKEVYAHFKSQCILKWRYSFQNLLPYVLKTASWLEEVEHSVCICTIHQNVKLMLARLKLSQLTTDSDAHLSSYHQCLTIMICNPPMKSCFFSECKECPGPLKVKEMLENIFEEHDTETITYKQWLKTDRSTLETIIKSSEDFLDT
jgi:hypothetical protein